MDTIEIKLPSGKIAIVRNYTTRGDDEVAEQLLFKGVEAEQNGENESKVKFPIANVMASQRVYIKLLVETIDGETPDFGALRSADYEALEVAVNKIVEQNSPKAQEAAKASKLNTAAK